MRLIILLAFCSLFLVGSAAGQTNPTDCQSLQAILAEIRQLRQDLRATNVAAQRGQILIYRVQLQQAVVTHLQQQVDDGRSKLSQIQRDEKRMANRAKEIEDSLSSAEDPKRKKDLEDVIVQIKTSLEMQGASEQETQAKLSESEDQLRLEQAKLGRLQDELDRLDKTLQESAQIGATPR